MEGQLLMKKPAYDPKIKAALKNSRRLNIFTTHYHERAQEYIDELLELYLTELGMQDLSIQLNYCLRELITNAKKANTKRVYFKEKGLDITNSTEYIIGMKNFSAETIQNIDKLLKIQKAEGYYIKVQLLKTSEHFIAVIRNNSVLTPVEEIRVKEKINIAKSFTNLSDAVSVISDPTEGSGLGLAIIVILMKNMGIDCSHLKIFSQNNETIASIKVPLPKPGNPSRN
jgi:hypothetical protein